MKFSRITKILLFSLSAFLVSSCQDDHEYEITSAQAIALNKVMDYSDNAFENPEPSLNDYIEAGVVGVNQEILSDLNYQVELAEREDVDTASELNLMVVLLTNSQPYAYDDLSSVILEITDSDVTEFTPEELEVPIPLYVEDNDVDDTLIYSIVEQPEYGKLTINGDTAGYTPDINYNGPDSFTFKASDGIADSNVATVSFKVISNAESADYPCFSAPTSERAAKSPISNKVEKKCEVDLKNIKQHLIWFNGTSETYAQNAHLFEGLDPNDVTRIQGWGLKPFWGDYTTYDSAIVGIDWDRSNTRLNVPSYINNRLAANKERIMNADSIMVGGFSRGAAFFVPYFLNTINDFLGSSFTSDKTSGDGKKEIIIYLMDPVHGSVSDEDKTLSTMITMGIKTKVKLIEELRQKGFKIKIIYMAAGFDKRAKNFAIDSSFLDVINDQPSLLDGFYTAKIGLAHSNMSVWSTSTSPPQQKKIVYGSSVYHTSIGGYLVKRDWWRVTPDTALTTELNKDLYSTAPDYGITKNIFRAFFKKMNTAEAVELEKTVKTYHDITDKWFGDNNFTKGKFVDYDNGDSAKSIWYYLGSGNNDLAIEKSSRRIIKKSGTISNIFGYE